MRTDQIIGLNERGRRYLIENGSPNGEVYRQHPGAWNPVPLQKYSAVTEQGVFFAREDIQAKPWSSGPCYFIGLRDIDDNWIEETLWTDEEIEAEL